MDKIFIEGIQIDTSEVFSTFVSYLIDDIKDFAAKNTNVSKTIIIPGTKNNNKVFGNIYQITSLNNYDPTQPNVNLNFNAAVKAQCHVFRDNLQALKGVMQLLAIRINKGDIEYEIGITGELGGFISELGSKTLDQLDFSAYNHNYTLANIIGSRANLGTAAGYIYANNIDYGGYGISGKKNWNVKTMRPALHVKEYIDKIVGDTTYTLDAPFFNTARFKKWIVPHNKKVLTRKSNEALKIAGSFVNTGELTSGLYFIPFETLTFLGDFTANSPANTLFTYNSAVILTGNLRIKLNATAIVNYTQDCFLVLEIKGVNYSYPFNVDPIDNTIRTINLDVSFLGISFNIGETIRVRFNPNRINVGIDTWDLTVEENRFIEIKTDLNQLVNINLGEEVPMNDQIPSNILQKDFFSSILKLSNLYLFEDSEKDKVLKIAPFASDGVTNSFFGAGTEVDWTNYLDLSQTVSIKPLAELNARYYEFNFKQDSDFYNEEYRKRYNQTYGSYRYDSGFQFSKEVTKVEVIFSGTPLVGYNGEDKVYSTIFKKSGNTEEQIDSNIRILQTKLITGVASWSIYDAAGTSILGNYTDYLYAGHLDDPDAPSNDINFGVPNELFFTLLTGALNVNQFNVYWSAYMAEITDKDARMVEATFKLPLKEIANLNFSNFIYVAGQLYRLNKIIDYNISKEDSCKVELIKVINKNY